MSQVPAKELSQLQSMTLAQLLPLLAPTLHMYLQLVVCVSPPMALLGEIIRSIRQQERKLLTVA
jgi:hypothetical protein